MSKIKKPVFALRFNRKFDSTRDVMNMIDGVTANTSVNIASFMRYTIRLSTVRLFGSITEVFYGKIHLDTYTERLLLKRTRELIKYVPYDVFVRIEQIVNEVIDNHFVYRCKLEELLALLQEGQSKKESDKDEIEQRITKSKGSCMSVNMNSDSIAFYNQIYDNEVVKYRKIILMMLASQVNVDYREK